MIKITLLLALMHMLSFNTIVSAQVQSVYITGIVTDNFGNPIGGAVVNTQNGKTGTSTNEEGEYSITCPENETLIFSFRGYLSQKVLVGAHKKLDIQLQLDIHKNDEVIQLGYTAQLRRQISGSVATVSGEELERSPVANLSQSFAGRLSGLTTMENYSELSKTSTSFYIRGLSTARGIGPLVIIDGVICAYNSSQTLEYISASEIESVSILKDASTQAIYGIQGANGLIVVTTKRGKKGDIRIQTSIDQSIQQVSTKPMFYDAADYAELRNQAAYNDGRGSNYFFSKEQIANYRSGENKELYPNNDWYSKYFKDFARMERIRLNASGGNDKVQFFSNVNFMHQGGQFITDQPKYDPNANNVWINYRTNVDMKLNAYLKAFVRLSGNVKRERTPGGAGNAEIYSSLFQIPPTVYGPLTPVVLDPKTGDPTLGSNQVVTTERVGAPTYGLLNRTGYVRHTVTNINSQFGLDLDMSFLTKGLSLNTVFAYQTNSVGSLYTTQSFERWVRTENKDQLTFLKKGLEINSPLGYGKGNSSYYHLTYNSVLNYKRDFGKHVVGGMAYMFYQNLTTGDGESPWLLPYNRVSSGIEASYAYDDRYLFKFDVGYSGSEQYGPKRRFIFTPSVSAGWVASREAFLSNVNWLSNLKLRASYGQAANDQSGLGRFSYLDNIRVTAGGPIGSLKYIVQEFQLGNPNIQPEVSTKQNYGLDFGLFNAFSFSVDAFKELTNNMVVSAIGTIPLYQGFPLGSYPQINGGKFENKGYEITASYQKNVNKDFGFSLGGMLSYAKNTVINVNEVMKTKDYAYRNWQEGYSYGQEFAYQVDYSNGNGFFNTQSELDNNNLDYAFGKPRLGDLKFIDLNKDGKVDDRDKAPIGFGLLPQMTYSFSGNLHFKAFDLNILFQGIGKYSSVIGGQGVWETDFDGVFGSLHKNAWTQERYNNGELITSPALSLIQNVNHVPSDYINYNRTYLRLKNLEIAYTLPTSLSKAISAKKIRFLLSGQNLITWDKMKSKDFGPEGGGYAAFPVYRVYNVGINAAF